MKKILKLMLMGCFHALFIFGAYSQTTENTENNKQTKADNNLLKREEALSIREVRLTRKELALGKQEMIQKRREDALRNRELNLRIKEESLAKNKEDDEVVLKSDEQTEPVDSSNQAVVVTKTPQPIVDAVMAAGGKYLVLRLEGAKGLVVYDAEKKNIVKNLNFPSKNFLYTAGGNTVLVYYPENNLLQTWDLKTFQRGKTKPNPKGVTISCLTMGHSNDRRALLRYALGTEQADRAGIFLLNLSTMKEVPLKEELFSTNSSYNNFAHNRANADMSMVTEWATSHSPTGIGLLILTDKSGEYTNEHDTAGYLAVGDDGYIYTQNGRIYNWELNYPAARGRKLDTLRLIKDGEIDGKKLIPGVGGSLFLSISDDGSMEVYASGSLSPITSVGSYPGLDNRKNNQTFYGAWAKTPFVFDRRFLFHPSKGYLLMIPPSNDQIIYRKFDLEEILEEAGENYLVVSSAPKKTVHVGETWQYKLNTLSNNNEIQYSLELAPQGMKISSDGKLSWKVTTNGNKSERVIVLVENGDGESIFHNFDLIIKPSK